MAPRPSWPAGVGGTRALRFEPLDRCRLHAVLLDGNGSGYDNTIVDPQTLILILRDAREIDVDALPSLVGTTSLAPATHRTPARDGTGASPASAATPGVADRTLKRASERSRGPPP